MKKNFSIMTALISIFFSTAIALAQNNGNDHGGGHGGGHGEHGQVELKTGRYTGTFDVSGGSGRKILAVLELIHAQEDGAYLKLKAHLKLVLGDHASHEYIGYEYESVLFDPETKTLNFESSDQDLILSNVMIHDKMLMGKFLSTANGAEGDFNVYFERSFELPPVASPPPEEPGENCLPGEPCENDNEANPGNDHSEHHHFFSANESVVETLAGEYRGLCEKEVVVLQLMTVRSREERVTSSRNPFSQYEISGSWGHQKGSKDPLGLRKSSSFSSGSYDFFSGELSLNGHPKGVQCLVQNSIVQCGPCSLKRSKIDLKLSSSVVSGKNTQTPHKQISAPFSNRQFAVDRAKYGTFESLPEPNDIGGQYFGYLHHERLDVYQEMRLDISAYYFQEYAHSPRQLVFNSFSQLYFQGGVEKITYRFDRRPWLFAGGAMIVKGHGETYGIIREWRKNLIILDWYSKNFGRVGTVELTRSEKPVLPKDIGQVASLTNTFLGPKLELNISAVATGKTGEELSNPFFPLEIQGAGRLVRDQKRLMPIETGIYDFYSGSVAIWFESGNSIFGSVDRQSNDLKFFISGVNSLSLPILEMKFEDYKRASTQGGHRHAK